jgi:hypothetical protein
MKKGEQRAMAKLIYILNKERVDTEALVQIQTYEGGHIPYLYSNCLLGNKVVSISISLSLSSLPSHLLRDLAKINQNKPFSITHIACSDSSNNIVCSER